MNAKYEHGKIKIAAPEDVTAGQVLLRAGKLIVAQGLNPTAAGELAAFATRGVLSSAAKSASTWSDGDAISYDIATQELQTSGGSAAGRAIGAKLAGELVGTVDLNES